MKIRKLIELVSRGKRFKRKLPSNFGSASIMVSPDAQLKYLKPGTEGLDRMLLATAAEFTRSGMTVWDVGANVGVFSVAAAARGASVVAFEPDVWLADLLERTRSLSENQSLDLSVIPVAISNKDGVAQFMIAERGRASNALEEAGGHSQMGGVRQKRMVPTLTLDTLCQTLVAPDFLKIDVEGAELLVLQGAPDLLRRRPNLLVEVSANHAEQITFILKNAGYRLFDAERGASHGSEIQQCTNNTLALAKV